MTSPFDPNYKSQIVEPKDKRRRSHSRKPSEAQRREMDYLIPRLAPGKPPKKGSKP